MRFYKLTDLDEDLLDIGQCQILLLVLIDLFTARIHCRPDSDCLFDLLRQFRFDLQINFYFTFILVSDKKESSTSVLFAKYRVWNKTHSLIELVDPLSEIGVVAERELVDIGLNGLELSWAYEETIRLLKFDSWIFAAQFWRNFFEHKIEILSCELLRNSEMVLIHIRTRCDLKKGVQEWVFVVHLVLMKINTTIEILVSPYRVRTRFSEYLRE